MKQVVSKLWAPALLGLALAACSTARRSEPLGGSLSVGGNEQVQRGHQVFMLNCQKCHPGGEAGAGPALNNVPLPGAALRFRIRSRAFFAGVGRMPSFKQHEISAEQLDDLVAYMKALRRTAPDKALTSGPVRAPKSK
ncbi:c-type cytochrome [Hymenobacter latericus]|uniref:c-type cytochrome n=1 Tax=Hymenobacter sp. YIM 151858-1 TaxID=2987688 RepID=UPI002226A794|nr:cytochrome c [Hymenobacter sp. YIM 151858-1]UYZ59903.1 cytochrome c [Hymenobacter sp. YIM 151858-1]